MQTWVHDRLTWTEERYPAERIAGSKARWARLWHGEAPRERYPFMYTPVVLRHYDDMHTPEQRLRASFDEFLARPPLDDDFIPTLFPGCHVGTIPSMFGAREIVVDNDYSCERLLTCIDDVAALPAPSIAADSRAAAWLAMQQYLLSETEGRLPIHVADMQGPADVCGKLLGYDELFTGAYTSPEAYHRLMDTVTDAFILFWQRQRDLLGPTFVGTHLWAWSWVPADAGATMSADSLVMISPAFYEEFYQPYIAKIGDAFGGVTVHSCGNYAQVVSTLGRTPGLRGINTSQMTLPQLLEAGVDTEKVLIIFAESKDVEQVFTLIKQHQLRVDLTIAPNWPKEGGQYKPVNCWTQAEFDQAREEHERIIAAATI